MKITLAQISPQLNRNNIDLHVDIINENIGNSDLIIFPELSLNGYLLMDAVYDNCYNIEELYIFINLSEKN
jgi:predicted amidohydrolase